MTQLKRGSCVRPVRKAHMLTIGLKILQEY